jgi:hypothetical protein
MTSVGKFSVNIVLHDFSRGWVIEKMAVKLHAALEEIGVTAKLSNTPSASHDVNHFIIFHYVGPLPGTLNTMCVTHVDDALKVDMVKRHLANGVRAAICMSNMTVEQLAGRGIERGKLTYVLPAHDGAIEPRRIVIGITSNGDVNKDGRKRDWLLTRLATDMRLDDFEFRIFGRGWDTIVEQLRAGGASVVVTGPTDDYVADYAAIKAAVPHFDYYFYPGLDEGSLGTLDALAAGVQTIVTTQGFHLDIPNGITHGFWEYEELRDIFDRIARDRRGRIDMARQLTWTKYAERHVAIWSSLRSRDEVPSGQQLASEVMTTKREIPTESYVTLLLNPYRRRMCLRFWAPRTYDRYFATRRRLGKVLRRLKRVPT